MATEQQIENRKKWVAALRSGEYRQGKQYLETSDGAFCCLGVACKVLGVEKLFKNGESVLLSTENGRPLTDCFFLDTDATNALGLTTDVGSFDKTLAPTYMRKWSDGTSEPDKANSLASLNDGAGWTFEQIADFIETNPKGLFKD